MIITIVKSDTKRIEETTVAEERRPLFIISMARTKAIGQMNAPATIFDNGYHLDPYTKLAGVIPGLQLQPTAIHAAGTTSATASANATPSAL